MSNKTTSLATPLFELHQQLSARLVDFAGFQLPIQYTGIIEEHRHTRQAASLFDVSHMGQLILKADDYLQAAKVLEKITANCFQSLREGQQRYGFFLNNQGNVIDDFMAYRGSQEESNWLFVTVNAARKNVDIALIQAVLEESVELDILTDKALLALQGKQAAQALGELNPDIHQLKFLQAAKIDIDGIECRLSRSGYTGEDGFEISVDANQSIAFAKKLLNNPVVKAAGLGARDSLRLEAGLPLYGNELTEQISPVSAGLNFAIAKRRREQADFPGAESILKQLATHPPQRLIGLKIEAKIPARQGCAMVVRDQIVGTITSGVFSPSLQQPIALAYIDSECTNTDELLVEVRNKRLEASVCPLPFIAHSYYR